MGNTSFTCRYGFRKAGESLLLMAAQDIGLIPARETGIGSLPAGKFNMISLKLSLLEEKFIIIPQILKIQNLHSGFNIGGFINPDETNHILFSAGSASGSEKTITAYLGYQMTI